MNYTIAQVIEAIQRCHFIDGDTCEQCPLRAACKRDVKALEKITIELLEYCQPMLELSTRLDRCEECISELDSKLYRLHLLATQGVFNSNAISNLQSSTILYYPDKEDVG